MTIHARQSRPGLEAAANRHGEADRASGLARLPAALSSLAPALTPALTPAPCSTTAQAVEPGVIGSSGSAAATRHFAEATHALLAHRPETAPALAAALAADPDHVGALALLGFARLMLARAELAVPAAEALAAGRAALARQEGGTADERALLRALEMALAGRFLPACDHLDAHFAARPGALLPFKLSQGLRFMAGDRMGMLMRSRAATTDLPAGRGAGFILGCHAFALEEFGAYDEAEATGRRAVALAPEDSWGRHAVSHVHEMRGQTEAGIRWLESGRPEWRRCNNFGFHMAWHLALLHLERGEDDRALALYDTEVRPEQTDDYRDMANAVSLLWRLERAGVAVGPRWQALAAVARQRVGDATLVFATLHTLAALVALKDARGVAELLAALEARAAGEGEQARHARSIGLPLARLMAGLDGPAERAALERLAGALPALGGSNAQRDFFLLSLVEIAARRSDAGALGRLRSLRAGLKTEDRLIAALLARAAT